MKKIEKYFSYLSTEYMMKIIDHKYSRSFPYITWSNEEITVKILYDFTDDNPVHIFIYGSDDTYMYSYKEIFEELKYIPKNNRDIDGFLQHASQVFKELFVNYISNNFKVKGAK